MSLPLPEEDAAQPELDEDTHPGETLNRVFIELAPLEPEARMRVLRAVAILFGTDIEEVA